MKAKENKSFFHCRACGQGSSKWLGRCPACGEWNSFIEETSAPDADVARRGERQPPVPISAVSANEGERLPSGIVEFDRVLGGGIVPGSAVLIGGEPGIGKSTLLLQIAQQIAQRGGSVLYVSGEESAKQIKLRGVRIGAASPHLYLLIATDIAVIAANMEKLKPAIVIVDSIQTIYTSELAAAPGSISQIREASDRLIAAAKTAGIPLFLVGHVTKEGAIAGPKVLEHMVDTVLYFEGDSNNLYRIVRALKNRFGPTNEIGVFEMRGDGLHEISNPSDIFLSQRATGVSGSVVVPSMEGTRPILLELQALVNRSNFGIPKRTTIGFDPNRVFLLAAVMDKMMHSSLSAHDIFINVAGGIRIDETAADLGIVAAMLSSALDKEIPTHTVLFGEVGLAGEVRGVPQTGLRIKEAARMGFSRCLIPQTKEEPSKPRALEIIKIANISELKRLLFP